MQKKNVFCIPIQLELSIASGFEPMQLGPRILRAETAPLAAITLCQYQYGDV